jgi:CheY-like chemotaxis protein
MRHSGFTKKIPQNCAKIIWSDRKRLLTLRVYSLSLFPKRSMKKILVIEDDESIRRSVGMMLRISGFEAFYAENGSIGLQMATQSMPDVIICDIAMPVMDGYSFIQELRKNPATTKIPVIFLTAKASEEDQANLARRPYENGARAIRNTCLST